MEPTREQVLAAYETVIAIGQTIRDLKAVPSGHLYARVMDSMSLSTFNHCIRTLTEAKLITRKNHMLEWIGPDKPKTTVKENA